MNINDSTVLVLDYSNKDMAAQLPITFRALCYKHFLIQSLTLQ